MKMPTEDSKPSFVRFLGLSSIKATYGERILISNRRKARAAFNKGQIIAFEFPNGAMGILDPNMDSSAWNGLQGRFYRFPGLGAIQHKKAIQIAS